MKKIFLFISILVLCIATCLFVFNATKDYDFFTALELCSQQEFKNPLDQFRAVIGEFEKFNGIFNNDGGNWWTNFWNGTTQFFTLIWNILKAPVLLLGDLFQDIALCFKCVLFILGFY